MKKYVLTIIIVVFLITFVILGKSLLNQGIVLDDKNWNVYFSNLKTSIMNGEVFVPDGPSLESTSILAYDVLISKPGDYATYTFDIINDGDYDASLNTLTKIDANCISLAIPENTMDEELACSNLEYKIFYTKDGSLVKENDIIKAHSKKNVSLIVGVSNDIQGITDDVQITLFDTTFVYNPVK